MQGRPTGAGFPKTGAPINAGFEDDAGLENQERTGDFTATSSAREPTPQSSVERGGDAVAVDGPVIGRCVGGIDAEAAEHDGRQHDKRQKRCFHGGHLWLRLLHLCTRRLPMR